MNQTSNNKMGVTFVPWTFPTFTIADNIFDKYYKGETIALKYQFMSDWPDKKINQLWSFYKKAVLNKDLKPISQSNILTPVQYLLQNTPYSRVDITRWVLAVYEEATAGNIDIYYLNLETGTGPLAAIRQFTAAMPDPGEWGDKIKWGGIIIIGVALFYVSWPYLSMARKSVKRRTS